MKLLPILCSTCKKYKIKRNWNGEFEKYTCFGSSMSRARKEKKCTSYSRDELQAQLVPSDSELLGW